MSQIAAYRLHNQQLAQPALRTPSEVVAWLGAVQAQEYAFVKWALGLRMQHASDDVIEQAFRDGALLRTHVLRPTWHFVTPADIRWLLDLTAPRVHAVNAFMYRKLELDAAVLRRSHAVLTKALAGGVQQTRAELARALQDAGIVASGMRLAHIMMHAELDGLVCSGARRGKQFTYALLEERVPPTKALPRDEALAELTRRYVASHGPALVQDVVWWSGLTSADVQAGLELAKPHVAREVVNGKTYWHAASAPAAQPQSPMVLLLPVYDEYTVAYKDHSASAAPLYAQQARALSFGGVLLIDGYMLGHWRRTYRKGAVAIEPAPFRPLTAAEDAALAAAAAQFGAFLGMPVALV